VIEAENIRRVLVGDFGLDKEEKEAIHEVLESGRISEGQKVREFEKRFASYIGTNFAIATSSGTAALITAITSLIHHPKLQAKRGTKVITTPLTYISTCNSIVLSGFEPVFVDVDPNTFGITAEAIEEKLKEAKNPEEFSFILPVHLIGFPCDMKGIQKVADKYGLVLVEDSAQAHGSTYNGKRTGSFGLWGIFSFYIAHNIQAGEMGAITTDDPEIAKLAKKLKTNGRMCDCPICLRFEGRCPRLTKDENEDDFDPRFTHDLIGYNFKLMDFQAALGLSQLRKADWIFQKRQENVKYLNQKLEKFSAILQLPNYLTEVSYLTYPIIIKDPKVITRKRFRRELEKKGWRPGLFLAVSPHSSLHIVTLKKNTKVDFPMQII